MSLLKVLLIVLQHGWMNKDIQQNFAQLICFDVMDFTRNKDIILRVKIEIKKER